MKKRCIKNYNKNLEKMLKANYTNRSNFLVLISLLCQNIYLIKNKQLLSNFTKQLIIIS